MNKILLSTFIAAYAFLAQTAIADVWQSNKLLQNETAIAWDPDIPLDMGKGKYGWFWQYADKQYGYSWFNIDASGKGKFWFQFSNGKKWDGDTFNAVFVLLGENDEVLHTMEWRAGMNSAGISGGAKERETSFPIDKDSEFWGRVKAVKCYYKLINNSDDAAFWDGLIQLVTEVATSSDSQQN